MKRDFHRLPVAIYAAMYLRVYGGDGIMGDKGRKTETIKDTIIT